MGTPALALMRASGKHAASGLGVPLALLLLVPMEAGIPIPIPAEPEVMLALDDALQRLAEVDPRASRIVELRYFVGLNNDEVANVIGISEKTVVRDWNTAKAWLRAELRSQE